MAMASKLSLHPSLTAHGLIPTPLRAKPLDFPAVSLSLSHRDARALALPKEQILSSLTQAEKAIDRIVEIGGNVFGTAKSIFDNASVAVKPGMDAAMPILQQAGEQAIKAASPALTEASRKAQEALQGSGIDTAPVITAAKTVAGAAQETTKVLDVAKPIATSTVEVISSSDPAVIAGSAGAAFLVYLAIPPLWSAVSFNLRGFKGTLTAAQTLDLVTTQRYYLIDIRSEKDKDKAGIPRLPSNARGNMIAVPLESLDNKLRGIVRDPKTAEAEIAALKISYLKRITKGANIVIIDTYTDSAKIVARVLTSLGFKKTWIVADGFSGGRGWVQSRLGTDSYNFSLAEVLSPSRVIPARFATGGTKLLSSGN